jgi:GTP-binding protein
LGMSALTGQGLEGVLPAVVESYGVWNQRIPTGKLNKWLVKVNPPPHFFFTLIHLFTPVS